MREWMTGGPAGGTPVAATQVGNGAAGDGVTILAPAALAPWLAGIEVDELSLAQRLLLTTDGTITHILEACSGERVEIVKLDEAMGSPEAQDTDLEPGPDTPILRRRVLIRASETKCPFIYAESSVAVDRLPRAVHRDLVNTDEPIGRLLFVHRTESLREILAVWKEPAGSCAPHFGVGPDEAVLCRTYRILVGGKPVMVITERFPAAAFR